MFFKNRLLKALLAPFFMFIDDPDAAALARGDVIPDDTTKVEVKDDAAEAERLAKEAGLKTGEEDGKKTEDDKKVEDATKTDDKKTEDDKKKDTRIPLSRHEAVLAKERERTAAAENELAKLRKAEERVESDKFLTENEKKLDALEEKYNSALIDGKTDEARALFKDMRKVEREISDHKADMKAAAAVEQATESVRYDTVVERIEAAYPEMVPGSEGYDKAKVQEILEMKTAFQLSGYKPSAALQKAVGYVLGASTKKQETATKVEPKVDAEDLAKKVREERKEDATKKAIDTAKKTPTSTASVGDDSNRLGGGKLDGAAVIKMSQSDFAKLDEKELAVLRGDEL